MPSVAEQILARILVVLESSSAVSVERGHEDPFSSGELPAINLRRLSTQTNALSLSYDEVKLELDLDLYAATESSVDSLHAEVHAALATDASLGQISNNTLLNTGTDSAGDGADSNYYRLTAHYEISAWVTRTDITQPA